MMSGPHGEGLWELLFKRVVRNDREDQAPGAHSSYGNPFWSGEEQGGEAPASLLSEASGNTGGRSSARKYPEHHQEPPGRSGFCRMEPSPPLPQGCLRSLEVEALGGRCGEVTVVRRGLGRVGWHLLVLTLLVPLPPPRPAAGAAPC